jgi:general secretion pathway protein D
MKLTPACFLLAIALLPLSTHWLRAQNGSAAADQNGAPVINAHSEAVTRQQLKVSANQAISDGQRFLASGNYDEAAKRFQFALDSLTPGGVSATAYNRAEVGLAAAKAGQAQALAKDYKFAQAAELLQQAVALQPENPVYAADIQQLKKQQLAYEEQIRDPEGTVNNPAVTDEFKDRVAAVQKLLFQGDAYFRTGQFEKSEETYSKILILDPYNKAARDKMAHIERYKERADGFRHEQYEGAAMEKVDHEWSEEISPDIVQTQVAPTGPATQSNRANITHKLQSIIIDKVNFEKLDIAAVIQFLQEKSKELDPDKQGVNFVLRLSSDTAIPPDAAAAAAAAPAATASTDSSGTAASTTPDATAPAAPVAHPIHREVSITLENVPLSDVLGYVIAQTNLQYTVEDYAVYLRPSIDEGETLSVRTYLVPPDFFPASTLRVSLAPTTDNAPSTIESLSYNAQATLQDKGIRFPAGASAIFLPGSSKLVVRDTPEQLDLVANLIDQNSQEPPQVQIEAKIAEFTQDAIKALSFNYLIANGTASPTGSPLSIQTALRTPSYVSPSNTGGLTPNSIDSLIQANASAGLVYPIQGTAGPDIAPNTPNVLTLGGVIDGKGFQVVIDMLNNMKGVSLLSSPNVTTQNGLKANIDIVREFPYPTSFEKPKLSNNSELFYPSTEETTIGGGTGIGPLSLAVPPTPREFTTQDVGVSLEVKPTTYPDKRIDLDITKCQVLDFDGFINYGIAIRARLTEDSTADPRTAEGTILTEGVINQPVFNLRSVVTNLQVLDGQTAVLGGLLREDTQEVNDKVPVLGDLPLIGRAFQSKVTERTKKNLIFFITSKLIKSNGKPVYAKTLEAEPEEEVLPEPDQLMGPGNNLPILPEGTPNS